jgi:hypothetical protein
MSKEIPLNERLIFALDIDSKDDAERWLNLLGEPDLILFGLVRFEPAGHCLR